MSWQVKVTQLQLIWLIILLNEGGDLEDEELIDMTNNTIQAVIGGDL